MKGHQKQQVGQSTKVSPLAKQHQSIPPQKSSSQVLLKHEDSDEIDPDFEEALEQELEQELIVDIKQAQKGETITDKEFYKAMQKLKERGSNALPPKKSASAYILFGKEKRAEILKRNPLAKVTEVVKEIAQSWRRLTKDDKQRFKEAAKKDKERYEKELRSLESYSDTLKKPKKCLSAYMIFVKETRPIIVEENHEMGALQVMQQVGKQWQALTSEQKIYFKDKADRDKVRYLKEQREFYDEVEKIGHSVGTVTNKEGQVVVATNFYTFNDPKKGKQMGGVKPAIQNSKEQQQQQQQQLLQKRKLPQTQQSSLSAPQKGESPSKRLKTGQEEQKHTYNNSAGGNSDSRISMVLQSSQNQSAASTDNKPKKPLSAYIYFSQEFREIIRQRFPFLTVAQIMNAVSYRWKNLSKDQKHPFEQIANEDKQRYDKESSDFKKGTFRGRSSTPQMKLQPNEDDFVSSALEISDDLLQFLQVKSNKPISEQEQYQQYENDIDNMNNMCGGEDQDEDALKNNNLKVIIENVEGEKGQRKDSFFGSTRNEYEDQHDQQQQQQQQIYHHQQQQQQQFQVPTSLYSFQPAYQINPFGFDGSLFNDMKGNDQGQRKLSLGFGAGGFYPNGSIQQSPALGGSHMYNSSPMLQFNDYKTQMNYKSTFGPNVPGLTLSVDDGINYLVGGPPFQLPPSTTTNDQQHFQQPLPQQSKSTPSQQPSKLIQSSPTMQASTNPQMNYLAQPGNPSHEQQYSTSFSPFLTAQVPQQILFQSFPSFGVPGNNNGGQSNNNIFR